ncbi:hypothetical protein LMG33810_002180 [Carnimonas sp. LMG 33810]
MLEQGLNSSFRKMDNGDIVYLGQWWGPEYLVSEKDRDEINKLNKLAILSGPCIAALGHYRDSFWTIIVAGILVSVILYFKYKNIVKKLSVSPYPKHSFTSRLKDYCRNVSWVLLSFSLAILSLINFFCIRKMVSDGYDDVAGICVFLLFLIMEIYFLLILAYKVLSCFRQRFS